jgi:hypothetical protein
VTSKWARLKNARLTFERVTDMAIDPNTGNEIPSGVETLAIDAYFKKASLTGAKSVNSDDGYGVPVGSYKVSGYTVGILPDWCRDPTNKAVKCIIDRLGDGLFCYQPKIGVVVGRVEEIGEGTPIQGYFTQRGG